MLPLLLFDKMFCEDVGCHTVCVAVFEGEGVIPQPLGDSLQLYTVESFDMSHAFVELSGLDNRGCALVVLIND